MSAQSNSSVPCSGADFRRFAAAFRVLEEAIEARAFPGCAFGVLAGEEVALQGALGRFTYETLAPAVTPETAYDVASLTKVVATTAQAMLLHQRGLLDLDEPLSALLPDFISGRAPDDPAHKVKIRHLLAHNSGLPGYVELFRTARTSDDLMRACEQLPLQADPGTRAEYSDPGFILLGKALEALTNENLSSWLRREVFGPLGMDATGFCPAPEMRSSIPPTEEDSTFRHCRVQGEVQDENAWVLHGVAGHAGLFSNVRDLLRFSSAILGTGTENQAAAGVPRLFAPATIELFAQRQGPDGSSCALGWDTPSQSSSSGRDFGPRTIGHLGFSGCSLWIDLDAAVAVVLLTNRTWPDRQSQLIRAVRPAFHDAIREAL